MSYKIGRYSRFDHLHVLTPFHVGMQFKKKMMNILHHNHVTTCQRANYQIDILWINLNSLVNYIPECMNFLNVWYIESLNYKTSLGLELKFEKHFERGKSMVLMSYNHPQFLPFLLHYICPLDSVYYMYLKFV